MNLSIDALNDHNLIDIFVPTALMKLKTELNNFIGPGKGERFLKKVQTYSIEGMAIFSLGNIFGAPLISEFSDSAMGNLTNINQLNLWWEEFGERSDPVVLLIMGAYMNSQAWPFELIERLVDHRMRVIRFDNRDSGKSTWFGKKTRVERIAGFLPASLLRSILKKKLAQTESKPTSNYPHPNRYDLFDMADDAIGLLDYLEIDKAHVIGASMGGLIAQILAIHYPQRVQSLGLMITTPGLHDENLSRTPPKFLEETLESAIFSIKGKTLEAAIGIARAYHGSRFGFDEHRIRARGRDLLSHGYNPSALHSEAVDATPSQLPRLRDISVPTIIVYGSEDPLIPTDHAEALKDGIYKSKLLAMEGVGHEIPDELISDISSALIKNMEPT